jgi:hypothetical protein
MKLHRVFYTLDGHDFIEFTSSAAGAGKIRVRVKKLKADVTKSDEVDLLSGRLELIKFLNDLTAHESSKED